MRRLFMQGDSKKTGMIQQHTTTHSPLLLNLLTSTPDPSPPHPTTISEMIAAIDQLDYPSPPSAMDHNATEDMETIWLPLDPDPVSSVLKDEVSIPPNSMSSDLTPPTMPTPSPSPSESGQPPLLEPSQPQVTRDRTTPPPNTAKCATEHQINQDSHSTKPPSIKVYPPNLPPTKTA